MDIISDKLVKIRKKHQCFACLRIYQPGTVMKCQVNKWDGSINSVYSCETCQALMGEFQFGLDDYENVYPEGAVCEGLEKDQTPEALLDLLRSKKIDMLVFNVKTTPK